MENTRRLLSVMTERQLLAREIMELKEKLKLPLRDREQEKSVLSMMNASGARERSLMNLIFEYTICAEENVSGRRREIEPGHENFAEIHGKLPFLNYIAGLLVSSPGREVYCSSEPAKAISDGIIDGGGHIIMEKRGNAGMTACIGFHDERCDLSVSGDGVLRVRPEIMARRSLPDSVSMEVA